MHALAAVRREIRSRDSASRSKYLAGIHNGIPELRRNAHTRTIGREACHGRHCVRGRLPRACRRLSVLRQRWLSELAARRPVVLGVEAVLSRDQQILTAWWRREIGEEELRKRLRFDREWGYDWAPFFDVLMAAREHADGIYGLDCMPRHDMRRIRSRDRHAAAKIREMRERHPQAALVVLFGESHMASEHLPRLVKRVIPTEQAVTVLQNVDALYWKAADDQAAAVSLGPDTVCVFNSSPLEKYESYRLCLEKWRSEDAPDFAPVIYNLIFSLARTLGFRTDSPRNGTQPKQLADSLPEVVHVAEDTRPTSSQFKDHERTALEERGCVYVQQTNTFYIREFKMAQAASECARFLHCACKGLTRDYVTDSLENMLAYFGARLLCPGNLNEEWPRHEEGDCFVRGLSGGPSLESGVAANVSRTGRAASVDRDAATHKAELNSRHGAAPFKQNHIAPVVPHFADSLAATDLAKSKRLVQCNAGDILRENSGL